MPFRQNPRPIRRKAAAILLSTVVLVAIFVVLDDDESTPAAGTGCESSPLFDGGFENGFRGWDNLQALPGRATIESGDSFCGSSHARFEIQPGDVEPETQASRAEVTGPAFSAGDDLWFRQATQLVSGFPEEGRYQIVSQWRSGSGSPPLALFVEDDTTLVLRRGDSPYTEFWRGGASTGTWIDLIFHIKFSQRSSAGFVEVWRDGRRQTMENGELRMNGQTLRGDTGNSKLGYYRNPGHEGTGVVLHDNYLIGRSLAAVAPAP